MQQVLQSNTARVRRSISCYALPSYGVSASDDGTLESSSSGLDSQAQSSIANAVDTRASCHRRTMSRAEDAESIENYNEDQVTESRREMYEELRARKESLESNLQSKMAELKAICIREAEITGVLPPETPLAPNESPPRIRRKVKTEFTITDKLLLEPQSEEEEKLSKLELDFEIQSKIVTASLKLMNEPGLKRRIRKQRKVNYDAAQIRLTKIEQELIDVRKRLQQESKLKYRTKKQLIEEHMSPSFKSVTHVTPMVTRIPASVLQCSNSIVNATNSNKNLSSVTDGGNHANGRIHIKEVPLSSLVEQRISSSREGISKSRAKKRGKLMMNGLSVNTSSSQIISSSVSSSTGGSSFRVFSESQSVPSSPSLKPRDIKPLPSTGHDVPDSAHAIIFNHHRQDNLLSDSSIGFIHQRSYSQGLPCRHEKVASTSTNTRQTAPSSSATSILKNKSQTAPSTPVKNKVKNVEPLSKGDALTRSNSLENVRRKSYISAVLSPAAIDYPFNGTHFYNPTIHETKSVPKNPPPPPPLQNSTCMAKRPLPPTPSAQEVKQEPVTIAAAAAAAAPSVKHHHPTQFKVPDSSHTRRRCHSGQSTSSNGTVDISSRAVRSSVIRTPVGIAISTTSSTEPTLSSSSNGITNNICTDSLNTALTNSDLSGQLHDSYLAHPARSASSSDSPSPSPVLKERINRSRGFSACTIGISNDLSDSTPQLSSSHSCCSSRSVSNAPSPTPSSASALALQQQCSALTFAPVCTSSYENMPVVDVTNSCHLSHKSFESDAAPLQVKEIISNMEKIANANYSICNVDDNHSDVMPPPACLPPRKPRKSHNVHRTVISPINCALAQSAPIAKAPLTPLSIISSQNALDSEVEATFTNAPHSETGSVISSARSSIETPRPDPIPILPHVTSGMHDVVSVGTYTPEWEEEKPFEFSDFIKYSAKHRAKQQGKTPVVTPVPQSQHHSKRPSGAISHLNQTNVETSTCSTPVEKTPNILNESFSPAAPQIAGEFNSEMIDWYDDHLNKATVV